jgi:uncharacterized protein (TIGR02996 family)
MTRDEHFLQDIHDYADIDLPRLLYADWLEGQGQGDRAEFIRVQVELGRLAEDDERRWALEARQAELLRAHGKHWAGPVRHLVKHYEFRRGFVEHVSLRAARFLEHADTLFRLAPVRSIRLAGAEEVVSDLTRCPHLARLAGLDLRHSNLDAHQFQTLFRSPQLAGLRTLNLCGTPLCNSAGARVVAACERLAELTELDLSDRRRDAQEGKKRFLQSRAEERGHWWWWDCGDVEEWAERGGESGRGMDAAGIRALADSPYLGGLSRLYLRGYTTSFGRDAVEALAGSSLLWRLTALDLSNSNTFLRPGQRKFRHRVLLSSPGIGGLRILGLARTGVREVELDSLVTAQGLKQLTTLDLSDNWLSLGAVASLAEAAGLAELTALRLDGCGIGDEELSVLARSCHFPRLARLNLSRNWFGNVGLEALARGSLLPRLRVLNLRGEGHSRVPDPRQEGDRRIDFQKEHRRIGDQGVQQLAASDLTELVRLDLGNQVITDAGAQALAACPRLGRLAVIILCANRIGAARAEALAGSPYLRRLSFLDLRSNDLPTAACRRLRQRFGYGTCYGPGPQRPLPG